jgi:small subunit ribosomal protein S20
MAHTRSAKKRLRQNEKRRLRNRNTLKTLKVLSKQVQAAAAAGDVEKLKTAAQLAEKRYDQAAAKGRIHPNKVARKKSQLRRLIKEKTGDLVKQ